MNNCWLDKMRQVLAFKKSRDEMEWVISSNDIRDLERTRDDCWTIVWDEILRLNKINNLNSCNLEIILDIYFLYVIDNWNSWQKWKGWPDHGVP